METLDRVQNRSREQSLRWCLLVEPTHAYADQPIHIKVSLANEDVLAGG